jgi:hypothetical protein
LNVLVEAVWVFEYRGTKKNCLFLKNWVIIANCYLCEYFMCGAASATPTTSKLISSKCSDGKVILTRLRSAW